MAAAATANSSFEEKVIEEEEDDDDDDEEKVEELFFDVSGRHHSFDDEGTTSVGGLSLRSAATTTSMRVKRLHGNVAHDRKSVYAFEYTKLIEAKTVAFHRRLERGKGLRLVHRGREVPVVLYAGHGLCWWRTKTFGCPIKDMKLASFLSDVAQCFSLSELTEAGCGGENGFVLRLAKAETRKLKQVQCVLKFSASTYLCREMIWGFELLRKHHTQIFFDKEQTGLIRGLLANDGTQDSNRFSEDSLPQLRTSRGGKFVHSRRSENHESAEFGKFASANALGERDDKLGTPTFKTKQAAIRPSLVVQVASFYEPLRNPVNRYFDCSIFDKIVEVYYEAFKDHNAKIRLPNGRYFSVPTEHFCDGAWITAVVSERDEKAQYTLEYKDGPFEVDDGIERKIAKFPRGTIFEQVSREDIHVDIRDIPIYGFPYFYVLVTIAQVAVFAAFSAGRPTWLAFSIVSDWPQCRDDRGQIRRYVGYQLVHSNVGFVAYYAVVQLVLGIPVELVHGFYRVGVVYIASVVVGALVVVAFTPDTVVVGASAGVYSLFGLHAGHVALNWSRWSRLVLLLLLVVVDVALALADDGARPSERAITSFSARVGGFFSGLALSFCFVHDRVGHSLRLTAAFAFGVAVLFLVLWDALRYPPESAIPAFNAREDLYCCFQALYCGQVDRDDYDKFECSRDGDKFIVWSATSSPTRPDKTLSCNQLENLSSSL